MYYAHRAVRQPLARYGKHAREQTAPDLYDARCPGKCVQCSIALGGKALLITVTLYEIE